MISFQQALNFLKNSGAAAVNVITRVTLEKWRLFAKLDSLSILCTPFTVKGEKLYLGLWSKVQVKGQKC